MAFFIDVKKNRKGISGGQLKFLAHSQLEDIDEAAKEILWHTGVKIPHEESLTILEDSGCVINRKENRVWIPSYLVDEAVAKAPHGFTYAGRDPKKSIRLEGNRVYFTCGAGGASIVASDGIRRRPTIKDFQDLIRLTDACENIDVAGSGIPPIFPDTPLELMNKPLAVRRAHRFLLEIEASEKPIDSNIEYTMDRQRISIEQAQASAFDRIKFEIAVRGSLDELRKLPMSVGGNEAISPMMLTPSQIDRMLVYAKHGLPILIGSEPMAGGTSPATVAGTLALWTAETLSCLVIAQMAANPSRRPPVIWVTLAGLFDQKAATGPLFSSPEGILMQASSAQIAHYYGFPIRGIAETSSKLPDIQAGYETALDLALSALAGINYNTSVGILGPGQAGMNSEKVLLDNDLVGYIKRIMQGVTVSDETLATKVIDEVGPGGNFLKTQHTRKWVKKQFYPSLFDRQSYDAWLRRGKKDATQRASERVKEILKEHWPEPLDPDIKKRIQTYVKNIEKREARKP
jgi:trimethylamine--corrinoid protein Co-methyltransferase